MTKTKKILAVSRWIGVYILLGIGQILAILFPVAWMLKSLGKLNPLWIVLDDTRIKKTEALIGPGNKLTVKTRYADDYWAFIVGKGKAKETFLIALEWHVLRNRVWNLVELFKVPQGTTDKNQQQIEVMEYVRDNLFKYISMGLVPVSTKVIQYGRYMKFAGLKFIPSDKSQDPWQVNSGDYINIKTSIFGTGFIWYKVGKFYSFRYSQCKLIEYRLLGLKLWSGYRTVKLGTGARYVLTVKHQKIKPWK